MKKLKNQYSSMDLNKIFTLIKKELSSHNATRVIEDYDSEGKVIALSFTMNIRGMILSYQLPARIEKVEVKLYGKKQLTKVMKEQAYRVAWANIKDWLSAQMALIDIELVKPEEVLLPYMLNSEGKTFFDVMEKHQFQLGQGEN